MLANYQALVFQAIEADDRFRLDDTRGLIERLMIMASQVPQKLGMFDRLMRIGNAQERATESKIKALGLSQREDPAAARLLDRWRGEQLNKITSLTQREVVKLGKLLEENDTLHPSELRGLIQERFDVTRSKADLLARDQTITLSARLSQHKMQSAGVTEYIWTTASDERVREYHKDLEGKRFRFDDPPIISPDGRRGNPGDDYQCRCVAFPVMDEFE